MKYNILILGKGSRESALLWKIKQSPLCGEVWVLPGNGGSSDCVQIDTFDFKSLKEFCLSNDIHIVMVGSEEFLVKGIFDELNGVVRVIGPSKRGAKLEGSKAFAKEFMENFQIPTARYKKFDLSQIAQAKEFLNELTPPYVLKADGLASGKGVLILDEIKEANIELEKMLMGKFGESSKTVVIEEFLNGLEFSLFVATDGKDWVLLPTAKDYKKIGIGDKGLNTGGMGAISPPDFVDGNVMEKVISRIVNPTIQGLKKLGLKYKGFIFFGLILVDGEPFVIEYNCRLGDPETQAILPRMESDLVELMVRISDGTLSEYKMEISENKSVCVVLSSSGYPQDFPIGLEITDYDGELVFQGGTRLEGGKLFTDGGRVISVVGLGETFEESINIVMDKAKKVKFEGKYYRTDIGR